MTQVGPFHIETVQGTPVRVYGRTLTPVARVISTSQRQGMVGEDKVEGSGGGLLLVQPVQVLEDRDGEVSAIPIVNVTSALLRQMAIVAAAVPIVGLFLVLASRIIRNR